MPKVTIGIDRIEAQREKASQEIRLAIVTGETMRGCSRSETIRHSGMSQASFYKAWKDPSLFRIGQLIAIYEYLRIPETERRFA